jgi:hypothetical protein
MPASTIPFLAWAATVLELARQPTKSSPACPELDSWRQLSVSTDGNFSNKNIGEPVCPDQGSRATQPSIPQPAKRIQTATAGNN